LKGKFVETVNGECIGSLVVKRGGIIPSSGFDKNLKPRNKTFRISVNSQGIRAFRGNGTGWVRSKSVSTRTASNHTGSLKYLSRPNVEMSHEFTYAMNERGAIRVEMVPGTFKARVAMDGSRLSGLSFDVDRRVLVGVISEAAHELVLRSDKPRIEIVSYSNENVVQRICEWVHRIMLKPGYGFDRPRGSRSQIGS